MSEYQRNQPMDECTLITALHGPCKCPQCKGIAIEKQAERQQASSEKDSAPPKEGRQ